MSHPPSPRGVASPPRPGPIPRSSSVSAGINFFESKTRSSTPPSGSATGMGAVPSPRRESNTSAGSPSPSPRPTATALGSPKPVGPRTMTPPSREGRRLSYKPTGEVPRRASDDPRKGLGLGISGTSSQAGRRVSEGGIDAGPGVAGPSRVRPKIPRSGASGSGPGSTLNPLPRSLSYQARSRPSQASPPVSRESSTKPVIQPRRPSDRSQPVIRVVQPTPRSQNTQRNISAPPESPVTPTRSRARVFSPSASSSKANSTSSTSSAPQSSSSQPRSIKPGTRRTSYQLAKTASVASNNGSSTGSISEFGVIGENGESPYTGKFIESFSTSASDVSRDDAKGIIGLTGHYPSYNARYHPRHDITYSIHLLAN
jgi:hypothetical protein